MWSLDSSIDRDSMPEGEEDKQLGGDERIQGVEMRGNRGRTEEETGGGDERNQGVIFA